MASVHGRAPAPLDVGPRGALNPIVAPLRRFGMDPSDGQTPAVPGRARAVRRRLMERVADADGSHLTVVPDDEGWRPFLDGIRIRVLHERDGVLSYLLRLAPGACLPAHRHPQDEECVVVEGWLQVGTREAFGPGSYHRAHAGALHPTIRTETGATIFLRGAVPAADQLLG